MASDQARMLELAKSEPAVATPAAVVDGARAGGGSLPAGLPVCLHLTVLASPDDPHSSLRADGAVLERRRRALGADQPRTRDLLRHRRLLLHGPVREVRHHAMDRAGGRHGALRARRHRHRRADAAPARALLRDRHAADRLERADHRAAMGLGWGRLRSLHTHQPHVAVALPAVPYEQDPLLLPGAGRDRGRLLASSGCCGAAASASACRRCATSPMRQPVSASRSPATRSWPS